MLLVDGRNSLPSLRLSLRALGNERNIQPTDALRAQLDRGTVARTTLSFYRYVHLADPLLLRNSLFTTWEAMGVLGRIYLAKEGVNAQLSVPTNMFQAFRDAVDVQAEFNGVPFKIAVEEEGTSFSKLIIKVRPKIVADGLADEAYDTTNVGEHLDATTFNRRIEEGALVIDMRNNYECMIGHFEGAYLPKADTFRGAIEEVKEVMTLRQRQGEGLPEVLLYCTGGIRCEKASAYLRHHGFSNVGQLHGGIIDYARQIKAEGLTSKYKGQNFVFDGRLAERITDDVVSTCTQCGTPNDRITNCKQHCCNLLLVQCDACATKYANCCSPGCREIHTLPEEVQKQWRKGRGSASAKSKAITDPEGLRDRIREEEELLALNGTLHPELTNLSSPSV
ncbi:MAG: rhodanese-related sulfurtransferase [Flavobacteriales bacterium]|nr:rhodanese-related sulfurtransferase [Flavobacteriales bacterium]MBP7155934.1 rhodanese-related sulfurtransferase [Flavobacteriales bacterium]